MSLSKALIVYRKELRDMLRDKRTIRSMIIIPVVAFPLLMMIAGYFGSKSQSEAQREASPVMIQGSQYAPKLMAALSKVPKIDVQSYQSDARQEVSDKKIRAVAVIPAGFDSDVAAGKTPQISIGYFEGDEKSELARDRLQTFFSTYRDGVARAALEARGIPVSLLDPFQINAQNVAPPSKVGAELVGGFVLYMIIIWCFTGGMYPAMDLTAGEKERGTMETILTSPISRADLAFGKFLTVFTASVVSTALSIGSLAFVWSKRAEFGMGASGLQISINAGSLLSLTMVLLPLAALFASVLIAVALYAKSYREAQSYISPMVFVVVLPGIIGMMPGIELSWKTAFVPILNISVLSKVLMGGSYPWAYIAAIFGMTCVYAAIALSAAVRMFNREDVLFRT
jgi:sodium transport system permease protein